MFKNRRHLEYAIIGAFSVFIIIALGFDTGHISPIKLLDNIDTLANTAFQAQVSIATIGIAILALLSGMIKESVLGISVIRYVTELKPAILKHKICILFIILSILPAYLSLIYGFFNTLSVVFCSVVILILLMTIDIILVFSDDNKTTTEIKKYYAYEFLNTKAEKSVLLAGFLQEVRKYLSCVDNLKLEDILNFWVDIFSKIDNKINVKATWETQYIDVCNHILDSENKQAMLLALKSSQKYSR